LPTAIITSIYLAGAEPRCNSACVPKGRYPTGSQFTVIVGVNLLASV